MTGLATASFLAFGTLLVIFGVNATEIMSDLDLDYAEFGFLGSMLSFGLGVGIVVSGPISDRLPRRPLYIASCLLVIVAATTLGPETSYSQLVVHMVAIGLGAGFYETILNAVIVERFADRSGRRLLFVHCGAALAACFVPLIIDAARETQAVEWFETFRVAGLVHLPLIVAALLSGAGFERSRERAPSDARPTHAPVEPVEEIDRIALAAICLSTFAYVGVETALTIFVVDHAATDLGLSATRAAGTISLFWGGLLIGRLAAGLSPRSPGAGVTALLAAAGAGVIVAFERGLFGSPELAMGCVGLVLGGVFPVMIGLAGQTAPTSKATVVGLAGGLGSLGGFVVPWATGRIATEAGLPLAFATLAGWLVLLSAAAVAVRLRQTLRNGHRATERSLQPLRRGE